MDKIIYCKDCTYCDVGRDEEGKIFYKCLAGHSYGGTTPNDFCSHANSKFKITDALTEIQHAAAYGLAYNLDVVPVHTRTLVKVIEKLEGRKMNSKLLEKTIDDLQYEIRKADEYDYSYIDNVEVLMLKDALSLLKEIKMNSEDLSED